MWEEWHASDVMRCRAHPAHCWLSPCQHHPMADIVCGSRVRCSAGKGPEPPAPKSGWTLCADVQSLGGCTLWLLVGCPLMWMSKQVAAMAPGPCSLLPSCPSMSSMTKLFHVPPNGRGGRGRGRRCLERCRDGWESALCGLGCNFTSCSAANYTLWGGRIWMVQATKSGRKQMLFKGSEKTEGWGTCMEKCFYTQHRTWWSLIDLWSMLVFL